MLPSGIVVGVDGSHQARQALAWAVAEARLRSERLHVVHALELPPRGWPGLSEFEVVLREEAQRMLVGELDAVDAKGVDIALDVLGGSPATVLIAAAQDSALLVIGSRGRGGFTGLLLGSVSLQCALHAPCPVTIVPTDNGRSAPDESRGRVAG